MIRVTSTDYVAAVRSGSALLDPYSAIYHSARLHAVIARPLHTWEQ
jgi:hypothetical protein